MNIPTIVQEGSLYSPGGLLQELRITDLTTDGMGVARHEGRVIFIDGALPGAVVNARITGIRKGVVRAAVETTLTASPQAVIPWCPHAPTCGACSWQHFSLAAAREWKRTYVQETLTRIGKMAPVPVLPTLASPRVVGHRNKMAFAFGMDPDQNAVLGLHRQKTHALVEITACGMQSPPAMDILQATRTAIARLGLSVWTCKRNEKGHLAKGASAQGYLRFLVIHMPEYAPHDTPQVLLELITGPNHDEAAGEGDAETGGRRSNAEALAALAALLRERFGLTGVVHSERRQLTDVAQGERLVQAWGASEYRECFGHVVVRVPYTAFLQTNTGAASLLYECIAQEAGLDGSQVVWDLYSGVGSISLYLARHARAVHGIEMQADAVRAARQNSTAMGYGHCHFQTGALGRAVLQALPPADVIVVDPPRAGMSEETVEALLQSSASTLISVSCDVGTQARDAARLAPTWTAVKSQPVDMFPYTPHVENLLVLKRAGL